MDITVRIAGEAGQGVLTTGQLLVQSFAQLGLEVLATRSYMSRIRGGLNWYDIRISESILFGPAREVDLLVALTEMSGDILRDQVAEDGLILLNCSKADSVGNINIDLEAVAKEVGGNTLYSNTVAAGAVMKVLGYDLSVLEGLLRSEFAKKEEGIIQSNIKCAARGAELAERAGKSLSAPKGGGKSCHICDGATAIGEAAAVAGVKFVSAYPMTPATATLTHLATMADKYGIVVEQAEDEIAAINMICGATYAGVVAMTMTSGGGFALMTEGLSLAGMMELPVVILIAQRPGPATGLPTRTAQEDLLFALRAGHGEFARAIFAPGSVSQCGEITRTALQTAHEYQTPVIILTDQFLQDMEQSVGESDGKPDYIDRHIVSSADENYRRYAVTDSGVSPRAIPGGGGKAFVSCDSDEHTAAGRITEDIHDRLEQYDKRMRKLNGMTEAALKPWRYGSDRAETLLVTWGSTYGPTAEAVGLLLEAGKSVAMLHFAQVWPINVEAAKAAIGKPKRLVAVEANGTGQFATLLRSVGVLGECELIGNYTGLAFTGADIAERIAQ